MVQGFPAPASSRPLQGQRVALAGQLAALTRTEAARLVKAQGGRLSSAVTRDTTLLVIGQQRLALRKDGRVSSALRRARQLQERGGQIEIIGEEEFLQRLGLDELAGGICGRYTAAQLTRLLGVPRPRLQSWIRHGLLQPVQDVADLPLFDFRQVAAIKALCELRESGVTTARLRRSLKQLSQWLPDARDALLRLSAAEGELLVRDGSGRLTEPSGQRRLDFAEPAEADAEEATLTLATELSADELFAEARQAEDDEQWQQAADLYHRWLSQFGPDAQVCYNLGNVLVQLNRHEAAIERYRQAVELDPTYAPAWNNMGIALVEAGRRSEAVEAFQRALACDSHTPDTLFNLADTLDELGREAEACPYWQAYLACESTGQWADYARSRLTR